MFRNRYKQYIVTLATLLTLFGLMVNIGMVTSTTSDSNFSQGISQPMVTSLYNISFHESGLPNGTTWAVGLSNTNHRSSTNYVNFTGLVNCTYTFTISPRYSSNGQNEYLPSPSSGTLIIHGTNQSVQVSFYNQTISSPTSSKTYDLNMSISNLPSYIPGVSWSWSACVSDLNAPSVTSGTSVNSTLDITGLANGTYQYSLTFPTGTSISPQTGQITISGKNLSVSLSFALDKLYRIDFTENGLPSYATFTTKVVNTQTGICLENTTLVSKSDFVSFALLNQTYTYSFSTDATMYTPNPGLGEITVSGTSFSVSTTFETAKKTYGVMFKISNPPSNDAGGYWYWDVYANGTYIGTSYNSTLSSGGYVNGTYVFDVHASGISLTPMFGSFTVNGSSQTINLEVQKSYSITFNAKSADKLMSYPSYCAVLTSIVDGIIPTSYTVCTNSGIAVFTGIPNGNYTYVLTPSIPWSLSISKGSLAVSGKNITVNLSATYEFEYPVVFTESGLQSQIGETAWGVVVDSGFFYNDSSKVSGLSTVSAPIPVTMYMPNGTYWIQGYVYKGGAYFFTQPQQVTVSGQVNQFNLQFPTGSGQAQGAFTSSLIALIIVVVVAAAVIGVLTYNSQRKKNRP